MSNFLSDASSQALAHLQSESAPTGTVVPDSPSPTPEQTTQDATSDGTVPDPATPELKSQSYKVKINGEEVDVALDELLKGYSRTGDYTRKAMELAQNRKQFEEERKQLQTIREESQKRETAIAEFLRDKEQVKRYYEYLTGDQLSAAQASQIDQASPQHIQQALQQQQQQFEARLQQMQQMTQAELGKVQQAAQARVASEMASEIDKTLHSLTENPEFAILKNIDDLGEILCADAFKLNPRTIDEAKAALVQVAQMRAEKLNAAYQGMLKESAIKQAKLKTQGIEPPGGTGVTPQPVKHKLGSKALTQAAVEWMNSQNSK